MKPPPTRRHHLPRRGRPDERGVTIILVAISMVGILAMAALSIDVVTLYLARLEAQRSADAAALTAARIISISGITGDPNDASDSWEQICAGETSPASQAAQAVASQNTVGGIAATTITVKYSAGNASPRDDCSRGLPAAFGVNPMVTVQVTRPALPTLFSRMWGAPSGSVTATATAEAFNPSNSGNVGNTDTDAITPVQPRCVKPWIVPNQDPQDCPRGVCRSFVDPSTGQIRHDGISLNGTGSPGVIGASFWLFADCGGAAGATPCSTTDKPPVANTTSPSNFNGFPAPPGGPNLEYLPGAVPASSVAVPSCGNASAYQQAVAGCDQTTAYQCGVPGGGAGGNTLDLSINPGGTAGDTAVATQCLIRQGNQGRAPSDADNLDTTAFPYKINAGTSNPVAAAGVLTTSNSIVSLPIYDQTIALNPGTTPPVTIIGFLQVFINYVDIDGSLNVTVLNVAGCGNGTNTTRSPVTGSSPVPVRLITPQ